ncbi:hypothetical protein Pyn_26598 [Prunus yedoensis var. nudiflora]|uniref:Uncharacterized protein n=1 Tax=Prunus yedoensis var. nudiflora TaxID=2094558 RepID=A0A315AJP9_PRUYE|nr:hypothetical protein Pyn_26598 [Prunus yedoensis var. nudiflora]
MSPLSISASHRALISFLSASAFFFSVAVLRIRLAEDEIASGLEFSNLGLNLCELFAFSLNDEVVFLQLSHRVELVVLSLPAHVSGSTLRSSPHPRPIEFVTHPARPSPVD